MTKTETILQAGAVLNLIIWFAITLGGFGAGMMNGIDALLFTGFMSKTGATALTGFAVCLYGILQLHITGAALDNTKI